MIVSSFGLFYKTGGQSFDFVNLYGDTVKIHGDGIYKNDSAFMAPIFRGTDFTILFIVIPLLIIAVIIDIKKNTVKTKLFLASIVSFLLYYSTSISFGVKYNVLHLVYIALFSCSFFAFLTGFSLLKKNNITSTVKMCTIGIKIFLILCGLSLFVAWLPDIIGSLINKSSLGMIEIYTTQITYVLDIGIVSPAFFICLYNLNKNNIIGYILLGVLLTNLIIIGMTVINQTIFHRLAGMELSTVQIITMVGIFVLLAIVGIYIKIKLYKNMQGSGNVI
jgi:hypothetical protein